MLEVSLQGEELKRVKTLIRFGTIIDTTLTLSLSGRSSVLEAEFFPPIELSKNKSYILGLVEPLTFNTIPNIDERNNKVYIVGEEHPITIPNGSYEIDDLEKLLTSRLNDNITLKLKANNNSLHCSIKCSHQINFEPHHSLASLLGFMPKILDANKFVESDHPVKILRVNALRVECNLTTGGYLNGERVYTIHEFFPAVPPGFKIIEIPAQVIHLPITVKTINHICIHILDQNGNLANFREDVITVRLHIKSI